MAKNRRKGCGSDECPCGSASRYSNCCGPYLNGDEIAETSEQLMRSRYTAYTLEHGDYLHDTWHVSTRPMEIGFEPGLRWLGLTVLSTEGGHLDNAQGWVEFIARCKSNGRAQRLQEPSRFVREMGRWYYLDGQFI